MSIKSEVIYNGEKFFEKYQKKIEIMLINHEGFSCIEAIVHGIRIGYKTTRVYFNSAALVTVMNVEQFNLTLDVKQKAAEKLNLPYSPGYEMKKLALNVISTVLIKGLKIIPSIFVSEFDLCFELNIQEHCVERNNNLPFEYDVIPFGLVPFAVTPPVFDALR
jgi:hypothetical protein